METHQNHAATAGIEGGQGVNASVESVEENEMLLELGPEFCIEQNPQPIFLAEAAHLLRLRAAAKTKQGFTRINPVLKKSLEYAEKFGNIDAQSAIVLRTQLSQVPGIHLFEMAQIASLLPKDAEEAKAIIPSLKDRYEDDELNDIIANLDVWLWEAVLNSNNSKFQCLIFCHWFCRRLPQKMHMFKVFVTDSLRTIVATFEAQVHKFVLLQIDERILAHPL